MSPSGLSPGLACQFDKAENQEIFFGVSIMSPTNRIRLWHSARLGGGVVSANGFSLLELMLVLVILIATSVLVMPLLTPTVQTPSGGLKSASEVTTQSTMSVIREAMVGEEGVLETLPNSPDALPREISDLVSEKPPTHVLKTAPQLSRFNPFFRIGWRGPYLLSTGVNEQGEPTVVDGWGREFQLHVDFDSNGEIDEEESRYIRVVSAGPNGQFETPRDSRNMKPGKEREENLTLEECGDDLVIFFCVPDSRK